MTKAVMDNHESIEYGRVYHAVNNGRVSRADLARVTIYIKV